MTAEMWTAVSGGAVGVASAVVTAWGARAARRTRRDHRRDDFTAVTDRMEKEITRQGQRIDELEADSEQQRTRVAGQDYTIRYLTAWVRSLYGHIRESGAEPPPPPQPVPDDVRPYLHDIGV
ncbi:hypothetical protein ACIQXD_05240 [Streptomyces uncialis]|uniref:hypothetical protein n=1 Tax=Streptomyces uncialis TaxID=1048205 RepID=UPI0037FBA2BC